MGHLGGGPGTLDAVRLEAAEMRLQALPGWGLLPRGRAVSVVVARVEAAALVMMGSTSGSDSSRLCLSRGWVRARMRSCAPPGQPLVGITY